MINCASDHPRAAMCTDDEGTTYCRWCEDVGLLEAKVITLEKEMERLRAERTCLMHELIAETGATFAGLERDMSHLDHEEEKLVEGEGP